MEFYVVRALLNLSARVAKSSIYFCEKYIRTYYKLLFLFYYILLFLLIKRILNIQKYIHYTLCYMYIVQCTYMWLYIHATLCCMYNVSDCIYIRTRILYISGQNSACLAAQQMVLQKIEGDAKDINSGDFVFEQIPN